MSLSSFNYFIQAAAHLHVKMLFYEAASTFHGHSGSWCHRDHWLSALLVHTAGKKVVVPKDDALEPGFKSLQMLLSYKRTKTNRNRSVSFNGNSLSNALCSLHLRSLCFKTPPVLWLWLVKEPLGIHDVDTVNTVQLGEKKTPIPFLFFFFPNKTKWPRASSSCFNL